MDFLIRRFYSLKQAFLHFHFLEGCFNYLIDELLSELGTPKSNYFKSYHFSNSIASNWCYESQRNGCTDFVKKNHGISITNHMACRLFIRSPICGRQICLHKHGGKLTIEQLTSNDQNYVILIIVHLRKHTF